ncbi:MAG: hypothetical protein HY301_18435 [Verrucomicrobia bacterium]|nr:hypothetical protein [Verrucomicrobiota bacterium]
MFCRNHPERRAALLCEQCASPICSECVVEEEPGVKVCSFACAQRHSELAREKVEDEKFDPWWTRIWSSAFLILLLGGLGAIAGLWLVLRAAGSRRLGARPEDWSYSSVKFTIYLGAAVGVVTAIVWLWRYFTRRL